MLTLTEARPSNRQTDLFLAATHERVIAACLRDVWVNVFDWERFGFLHRAHFETADKLEVSRFGWCLRLQGKDDKASHVLRMIARRQSGRYSLITEAGPGAGTEVRVHLSPLGHRRTHVKMSFFIPEREPNRRTALAKKLASLHQQCLDADETMILRRAALQESSRLSGAQVVPRPLELGKLADVKARAPFTVGFGSGQFRIYVDEGEVRAFSAICSHLLGPLDQVPMANGEVECPWHGLRFNVRTGMCSQKYRPKLAAPPDIVVTDGVVWLVASPAMADLKAHLTAGLPTGKRSTAAQPLAATPVRTPETAITA